MSARDDFNSTVVDRLARRASFICSNPDCRCMTLAASIAEHMDYQYIGIAAHMTAASSGGPRYDASLTAEQRGNISNGIFLCANCATTIDKNNGVDFSVELLKTWKDNHEDWVRGNLNKSIENSIVFVDGEHHAQGEGVITGLEIKKGAIIKPGTISTASGKGVITATKIG